MKIFRSVTRGVLLVSAFTLAGVITPAAHADEHLRLLPQPKQLERGTGSFTVTAQTRLFLPGGWERSELLAARQLRNTIKEHAGPTITIDRLGILEEDTTGHFVLTVQDPPSQTPREMEGYQLSITTRGVALHGNSLAGVYYGLQTLNQLADQFGAELPVLTIEDEPDFEWRGFHQDVSRGRVPTLEALKWQVDYLASHKANMYQLYVEHPFMFRFNPAIAQNPDGLTPEEILELDLYCRDRRITFVPSLQSFGHMAGVLSLPEYRHLADVPLEDDWEDIDWRGRMRGATLNTLDPDARALLAQMWDAYMPLFTAPFANASADETYDLGRGQGAEVAEEIGVGRLYLRHIDYLNELAHRYDKRLMMWGDIIKQHAELIPEISEDIIMLNWGYHQNTRYEDNRLFAEAGLDFFVCPGTSGWRRIINDILNAELNIRRFIESGKEHGAIGVLNTDWGDYGHYNVPAGSLHGFALGNALAWNSTNPQQEEFDAIWAHHTFGPGGDDVLDAWRQLGESIIWRMTWAMLFADFESDVYDRADREIAQRFRTDGMRMARTLENPALTGQRWIIDELHHAARAMDLLGEKLQIVYDLADEDLEIVPAHMAARLNAFADRTESLYREYKVLWRARSKESDLADIGLHIDRLTAQARQMAADMEQQ